MERMLGSIFADLHILKIDMNGIFKILRNQSRCNKVLAVCIMLNSFSLCCAAAHCINNKEKIEELTKEVEELKKTKGE